MIRYLFDTSAILAHYFGEAGAAEVDALFQEHTGSIGISVVCWPELRTRLDDIVKDTIEVGHVFQLYTQVLTKALPVTVQVAEEAIRLRSIARARLPLIDSLIGATASLAQSILVHRDPHFSAIPRKDLMQHQLPDK